MLENDNIIDSAEESFFDMDPILGLTDDEFHGDMELFMTHYGQVRRLMRCWFLLLSLLLSLM